MVKKISFLILSVIILVIGIIAFSKLSYWDRSVRIFNYSLGTPLEGRPGRGPGDREFEAGEGRPDQGIRERNIPDSLRQQFRPRGGDRLGSGHFYGEMRNGEGRRGGEFAQGKKINIRNVKWFLAVFAAFTVIVIYTDKAIFLMRKRKGRQTTIKEII